MPIRGSTSTPEFPDWAHLPDFTVQLISEKVKSIVDYVRFRAVCSSWRSSSSPKPRHLPPQLPWLMIHRISDEGIGLFYDLWAFKMRKLHLPETNHMSCLASCRGWLLLTSTRGRVVFLLNPITRARIPLPPFSAEFKHISVSKVTFSTDLTDPNCLIMVFHQRMRMIQCCRVGEPCWRDIVGGRHSIICDATYYDGRFYLLYQGAMEIIEPSKPEKRIVCYFKGKLQDVRVCFLEGNSGVYVAAFHPILGEYEIYSAADDRKKGTVMTLKTRIELYQFKEQSFNLEQITDKNNTAIFSEWGDFFMAVSSDYFGGNYIDVRGSGAESNYHICSTKLDTGKSKVVCDLDPELHIKSLTWFQPSFD